MILLSKVKPFPKIPPTINIDMGTYISPIFFIGVINGAIGDEL